MKINIKCHDLVNYVLGTCRYHPLELEIDPTRYEISENSILDIKTKTVFAQEEDYRLFMKKINTLKLAISDYDSSQVQAFCREIEDLSPLQINLL